MGQALVEKQSGAETSKVATPRVGRIRKWRRRLVVVVLVLAAAYWFRAPLLRTAAWPLVVDEAAHAGDYVFVLDGDRCFSKAAERVRDGLAPGVLVARYRRNRLQQAGILEPYETIVCRELRENGAAQETITLLPGEARNDWDRVRALRRWLDEHPNESVTVFSNELGTRRRRLVLDQTLGADAARVRLTALPHRNYDRTNWWRRKEGVLDLFFGYVLLAHSWWNGEGTEPWREWDPDSYEASLR
jgi:hypothetical protein